MKSGQPESKFSVIRFDRKQEKATPSEKNTLAENSGKQLDFFEKNLTFRRFRSNVLQNSLIFRRFIGS